MSIRKNLKQILSGEDSIEIMKPTQKYMPTKKFETREKDDEDLDQKIQIFLKTLSRKFIYKQKAEIFFHLQKMIRIALEKHPTLITDFVKYMLDEVK